MYYHRFVQDDRPDYLCPGIEQEDAIRRYWKLRSAEEMLPLQKDAVRFEGMLYDTWNHKELYLEKSYGDYWSLPASVAQAHAWEMESYSDSDRELVRRIREKTGRYI